METQSVPEAAGVKDGGGLTASDYGFFALMVIVLIAVTWVGVLSYEEGMNTEKSKRNGEAWVAWLTDNSAKRFESDYALAACAGGPRAAAAPETTEKVPVSEGETLVPAAPPPPPRQMRGAPALKRF